MHCLVSKSAGAFQNLIIWNQTLYYSDYLCQCVVSFISSLSILTLFVSFCFKLFLHHFKWIFMCCLSHIHCHLYVLSFSNFFNGLGKLLIIYCFLFKEKLFYLLFNSLATTFTILCVTLHLFTLFLIVFHFL